jgi:RNA polymerase sigma factor (sigma-70 family)
MATSRTNEVIQHLRRAVLRHDRTTMTDDELLGCFIEHRDDAAFADLVRRHGPMVWGVCRRLLGHHDAEDAFQAAFLVLVRKAASVVPRGMVANWLYGVAHQTALQARRSAARRRARDRPVARMPEPAAAVPDLPDDLRPLLDQELSRLPDKYRAVLVLAELEGKTRKEVARQLGLPEGTAASRLTRARAMLAKRLAQRGVALSGVALAAVLSQEATSAAGVPTSAASAAIQAASVFAVSRGAAVGAVAVRAVSLAEGVLRTMLLNKLKAVGVAVLAIALLLLGGGAFAWRGQASEPPDRRAGKDEDLKKKLLELDELWWKGGVETLGKLAADDLITVSGVGRYDKASLLEASKNRHPIDWTRRDIEVSRVSKDVAIVTYRYDCKIVRSDGTPVQDCRDRRVSMTWVNREGGWVVVFTQETILPGGE